MKTDIRPCNCAEHDHGLVRIMGDGHCRVHGRYGFYDNANQPCPQCAIEFNLCRICGKQLQPVPHHSIGWWIKRYLKIYRNRWNAFKWKLRTRRFKKVLLPNIRRTFPELITNDIVGVQPMSGPVGLAFTLRYRYDDKPRLQIHRDFEIDDNNVLILKRKTDDNISRSN